MDLLIYLPAGAEKPVPLLLHLGFAGNSQMVEDPELEPSRIWGRDHQRTVASGRSAFGTLPVRQFLDAGFGFALVYYGDIEPDFNGGFEHGVRKHFLGSDRETPAPDEWGTVAAWAWGLSRAMDYFETDVAVDHQRVAINGASRLGKTAVWAMAEDQRFALLLSSVSGEGGAALSRRDYGETIAHLMHPDRYPYWYCDNYGKLAADPKSAPVDGHMLLALAAPRPVLLQTGRTDKWSDPMGEWKAGQAASPVWELSEESNLSGYDDPPTAEAILNTLGWYMHDGGHGVIPADWKVFLAFMEKHLK